MTPRPKRALRFAAFQLIGAAAPKDAGAAIGAKLASGFGYRHHVFWDTDLFVVPYFTVTQPDLARSHLGYRYQGLDGARRKAKRFGREGAFYAWESAGTGDEVTPEWTTPVHGLPIRIWTGELEEHITSDVAYAAHHYWQWSGDDRFMADQGWRSWPKVPAIGRAGSKSTPRGPSVECHWTRRVPHSCDGFLLHQPRGVVATADCGDAGRVASEICTPQGISTVGTAWAC